MRTVDSQDIVEDLLRSAWIIEAGRARHYRRWSEHDSSFERSAARSEERAAIVARSLEVRGPEGDDGLAEAHSRWIESLTGTRPGQVPLGELLVVRLGDWVEAHAAGFLESGADELRTLGDEEKESLSFPSSLPDPPAFEPVETPVVTAPGPVRFRFGILGDLHFGSTGAEETARAAIGELNDAGVELVIQLGDITDHGNKEEFELATRALAELQMPLVTMLGNHDVFSYQEERLSGREYYGAAFGREPDGVLLEHGGFRFAVLDSADIAASPFAPFDMVTGTLAEGPGGAVVRGALTEPQHDILAEVAAPHSPPAFVFLHHPPQPYAGFPPVVFGLRDSDTGRLHATCDSGNVWGIFAGHTHRNARTRDFDGVPAHEVAIARDYPFGYAVVDVADNGYAYRWQQLSDTRLLERSYPRASAIHRRYGRGTDGERAFVWRAPGAGAAPAS